MPLRIWVELRRGFGRHTLVGETSFPFPSSQAPAKTGLVDMCTVHVTISLSIMCRSVHVCSTWAPSLSIHSPKAAASRPLSPPHVWMRVQLKAIDDGGDYGGGARNSKVWEWYAPCTRGYAANPISSLGAVARHVFRSSFTPNSAGGRTPFEGGAGSVFAMQFAVGPRSEGGAGAFEPKGVDGGWRQVSWHVSGLCIPTCLAGDEGFGDGVCRDGYMYAVVSGRGGDSAPLDGGEHYNLPPGWTRIVEPAGEVYMHVTGKKTNKRPAWGAEGVGRGGRQGDRAVQGVDGPCFRIAFHQSDGGGSGGTSLRVEWFECEMDVK